MWHVLAALIKSWKVFTNQTDTCSVPAVCASPSLEMHSLFALKWDLVEVAHSFCCWVKFPTCGHLTLHASCCCDEHWCVLEGLYVCSTSSQMCIIASAQLKLLCIKEMMLLYTGHHHVCMSNCNSQWNEMVVLVQLGGCAFVYSPTHACL